MGKDTIDRANRVLASISASREAHKADEREKNRRASAMLNAIAGLQPNFAPLTPRFIGIDPALGTAVNWQVKRVTIEEAREMFPAPDRRAMAKEGMALARQRDKKACQAEFGRIYDELNRRCICCGAPASEVQHD